MQKILKQIVIEPIDDKTTYAELVKKYDVINTILAEHDPNKIMQHESDITKYLKKLVYLKNSYVLKSAIKSKLWTANILELQNQLQPDFKKVLTYDQVEDAFIQLLKEYLYDWYGFWSIISMNAKYRVTSIKIFDLNDYNKFQVYVTKKTNKITKQKKI